MQLTILGCGSAVPTARHQPACQVLTLHGQHYMIDCGEGAQGAWRACGLRYSRLHHIFISHLHSDHVLGLPGLLATMSMHDTRGSVTVHAFDEGIRVLRPMIEFFIRRPSFDILFEPLDPHGGQLVLDDGRVEVMSERLHHPVPCVGFRVRAKASGAEYGYCSDTAWREDLAEKFRGVDVLYHDATFADDRLPRAQGYGHSTARQAAQTALGAEAGTLLLGHFSKAYRDEEAHLAQAREVFANTLLAREGMTLDIHAGKLGPG